MPFITIDDFYKKVSSYSGMSREEELECAKKMKEGDAHAREQMIQSYLPMVASRIKHAPKHMQNLGVLLYCQQALEKAVDSFDFFQDSEPFSHRLNWYLRQAFTDYITKQ